MAIRLTTPYYLAGKQKERFHTNQMGKGATGAIAMGVGAAALTHPKTRGFAVQGVNYAAATKGVPLNMTHGHAKIGAQVLAFGAGASAAYGGYHALRAANYRKQYKRYYYRRQNGKQVRVKAGKR